MIDAGDTHEIALACTEIWLAAIRCYYSDCRSAMGKAKFNIDYEALEDLTGNRKLLANLCRPLDVDPDMLADLLIKALESGKRWTLDVSLACLV